MNEAPCETRQLRLFVAAHVAAPVAIYGLALAMGGGLASTPFPPDLPHVRSASVTPQSPPPLAEVVPPGTPPAQVLPSAADLEAPWATESAVRTLARND